MSISQIYRNAGMISRVDKSSNTQPNITKKEVGRITQGASEFETLFQKKVNLSQHAQSRIKSRDLKLDNTLQKKIVKGLNSAESKGSREALILADDLAFIANVKSRTIITAIDRHDLKDHIFTNIDSTVLV